jgi:hypothetical protein
MLRYGMIVKLTKPAELYVCGNWVNVRAQFRTKYEEKVKKQVSRYQDYQTKKWIVSTYEDTRFVIPVGTVCVLKECHVDYQGESYTLVIPNPVTNKITYGAFCVKPDDFTVVMNETEKESIAEAHAALIMNKTPNNLVALKRIRNAQDFDVRKNILRDLDETEA